MLVMVCVQALHRLWVLLVRACNLGRLEDEQPGEESFDLDRFGRHLEGPTAALGTVTGRILSNAGRGNCFWYAISQLRFGHSRSWRKIKIQVLGNSTLKIQKKLKAGNLGGQCGQWVQL